MNAKQFIEGLFRDCPESGELADFREELIGNLQAKIDSLVEGGMDEDAAFAKATEELGDVRRLAEEFLPKERRETPFPAGFTSVALDGAANLRIHPGESRHRATVGEGKSENCRLEVRDGVLHVENGRHLFDRHVNVGILGLFGRHRKTPTVDVYLGELRSVTLNGAGRIVVGDGDHEELEARIRGCGEIDLGKGTARCLKLTLSGSGSIKAERLRSEAAELRLNGVGEIRAWAEKTVDGKVSGVGSIRLRGDAAGDLKVSGVGGIVREKVGAEDAESPTA